MRKEQKAREQALEYYWGKVGINDGALGKIFEIECASHASRKIKVAEQGEKDIFVKYEKGNHAAECKTNGGRVESLYSKNAPKFVIYRLDYVVEHKAGKHTKAYTEVRTVDPVIIPTTLFLAKLEQFNAIKNTNGKQPERAIQVSSKKWYLWLASYPVKYDPERRYYSSDFDGLK